MKHALLRTGSLVVLFTVLLPLTQAATTDTQKTRVLQVVDGDTFKVQLNGKRESVRIIGIDTPETVDPRKTVQCFGKEASAKLKKLLLRKTVTLERNPAEDRDKYNRLLRYVNLNKKDIGAQMIQDGYAFSYKQFPHPRLDAYNELETKAREESKGLWSAKCEYAGVTTKSSSSVRSTSSSSSSAQSSITSSCTIKGNISSDKERIFHVPGCASYSKTVIDTSAGEKWFCSEAEAEAAGWRKALNCP